MTADKNCPYLDAGRSPFYFWYETECITFLNNFRKLWSACLMDRYYSVSRKEALRELTTHVYDYIRVGHDHRPMTFDLDGRVGIGAGGCEVFWNLVVQNDVSLLEISSPTERTCVLRRSNGGHWHGAWEVHEQMPVQLQRKAKWHPTFVLP